MKVKTVINGVEYVGTLQPVEKKPAKPVVRICKCKNYNPGPSNQRPLFWVNIRFSDSGPIRRYAVGSDIQLPPNEHSVGGKGPRKLHLRPEYESSGKTMKKYSRNPKHPNHGFFLYINSDGTACVDHQGRRIIGQARNQ